MEGLTILNTIQGYKWCTLFLVCLIILIVCVLMMALIWLTLHNKFLRDTAFGLVMAVMLICFFNCLSLVISNDALIPKPKQYECIIDTDYFKEIMAEYRVVDRRGDIWVLEDIEDENE